MTHQKINDRRMSNKMYDQVLGVRATQITIQTDNDTIKEESREEDQEVDESALLREKNVSKVKLTSSDWPFSIHKIMCLTYQWGLVNAFINVVCFLTMVQP